MILLPKPGRPCKGPADMRPIGLSRPIGKAILRALRAKILPFAQRYMACVPQWGFVPGREVADALARAFGHCQAVQQLCKQQSTSINNRMDGIVRRKVAGGLAVALDISGAFDTVRHSEIMLALQAADGSEAPNITARTVAATGQLTCAEVFGRAAYCHPFCMYWW